MSHACKYWILNRFRKIDWECILPCNDILFSLLTLDGREDIGDCGVRAWRFQRRKLSLVHFFCRLKRAFPQINFKFYILILFTFRATRGAPFCAWNWREYSLWAVTLICSWLLERGWNAEYQIQAGLAFWLEYWHKFLLHAYACAMNIERICHRRDVVSRFEDKRGKNFGPNCKLVQGTMAHGSNFVKPLGRTKVCSTQKKRRRKLCQLNYWWISLWTKLISIFLGWELGTKLLPSWS